MWGVVSHRWDAQPGGCPALQDGQVAWWMAGFTSHFRDTVVRCRPVSCTPLGAHGAVRSVVQSAQELYLWAPRSVDVPGEWHVRKGGRSNGRPQ
jgi:hypothetical protein